MRTATIAVRYACQQGTRPDDEHPIARNLENGIVMATHVSVANNRITRAVGLLSRDHLTGEALWIMPCRGVHTCGMRFTIDVVALDADGTVVDVAPALRPWRSAPRAAV